jgi:hypothetical protein
VRIVAAGLTCSHRLGVGGEDDLLLDLPAPNAGVKVWVHDKLNVPNQVWRVIPL